MRTGKVDELHIRATEQHIRDIEDACRQHPEIPALRWIADKIAEERARSELHGKVMAAARKRWDQDEVMINGTGFYESAFVGDDGWWVDAEVLVPYADLGMATCEMCGDPYETDGTPPSYAGLCPDCRETADAAEEV